MSAKQDRQGVRTAAQLEQKWKFGESFAKAFNMATDAQNVANAAKELAEQTGEKLTQDQIFNILTNNGANQGLYRGEDGELYVNATYIKSGELIADLIKSGVLQSVDGRTYFSLENGNIVCTDEFGSAVQISLGNIKLRDGENQLLRIDNLGFAGAITFYNYETGKLVGWLQGYPEGLAIGCDQITCNTVNDVYMKKVHVEGGTSFNVTTCFESFGTTGHARQAIMIFGCCNTGSYVNGVARIRSDGECVWSGSSGVTVAQTGNGGEVCVTLPGTAWDDFVLISAGKITV